MAYKPRGSFKGNGDGSGARGRREAAVTVKSGKGRTLSSKLWLERQLNDPYVAEAKRLGYRSRAAFKLIEIDDRFHMLKPGARVVDLGCAPGGWLQVAVARTKGTGRIVGIDLLETEHVSGATAMVGDFLEEGAEDRLIAELGGPADVVLSDMAAATTGHARTDHLRVVGLVEAAYAFAAGILQKDGAFVAKVFQGGTEGELLNTLKRDFQKVMHVKPKSSRKESPEMYVVALGFRGANDVVEDVG